MTIEVCVRVVLCQQRENTTAFWTNLRTFVFLATVQTLAVDVDSHVERASGAVWRRRQRRLFKHQTQATGHCGNNSFSSGAMSTHRAG